MNDESKWATYKNLSFAPIQISSLLQSSKTSDPAANAEADAPLQNGKHAEAPAPAAESAGLDEPEGLAAGEAQSAQKAESSKTIYRIGVGAAAFVVLSLVVVFLIRPNVPSAAAPQISPTAATQPEATAPLALTSGEAATQAQPSQAQATQAQLSQQLSTEALAAQPTATQAPPATATPAPTPVPLVPRVELIPHALAYTVGATGEGDIYVMPANKFKPVVVANAGCDEAEPDWSPDGKRLVFQSNCNGSYDLADVLAEGGKVRFLTSTEQYDELDPSYSPDGKSIVFLRLLHGTALDAEGDLWSLNIENGHSFPLDLTGRAPAWSADGLKLAYMSLRSGTWDVYVHDFISGSDDLISFGCPTNCGWPEWSPDSTSIAYSVTADIASNQPEEIWLWSPQRRLPQIWLTGAVGRPSWSSAGLIAYNSGLGLEISKSENPERQLLLDDATAWAPEWAQ